MDSFIRSKYPEWSNDHRARSLFASFNQERSVNPESWDYRVGFWRTLLKDVCREGFSSAGVFALPLLGELEILLQRDGTTPLGLAFIIKTMISEKELLTSFPKSPPSSPTSSFLYSLFSGVTWALSPISKGIQSLVPESSPKTENYKTPLLIPALLDEMAEKVVQYNSKRVVDHYIRSISFTTFKEMCQEIRRDLSIAPIIEESDYLLLRDYLTWSGDVVTDSTKDILKIRLKTESKGLILTDVEINCIKLTNIHQKLEVKCNNLTEKYSYYLRRAKENLKDRPVAAHNLRRSKEILKERDLLLEKSLTLAQILFRIESCHSDKDIFDAYSLGEQTLKSLLSSSPSACDVDDVLLGVEELLMDQSEISSALSTTKEVDEDSLLSELDNLLISDFENVNCASNSFYSRSITNNKSIEQQQEQQQQEQEQEEQEVLEI